MRASERDLSGLDRRAVLWGLAGVVGVVAITYFGSERLVWFDAALIGYLYGICLMVFGVIYRYKVWVRRPPTAMLNRRGWEAFRSRLGAGIVSLPRVVWSKLVAQDFIRHRSRSRWFAHQLVFWGCILAALITFPLTLGIFHFESVGQDDQRYRVYLSMVGTIAFDAGSVFGWIVYHGLDLSAVLVLAGVFMFLGRRLHDPGALATERSGDFLALAGLFAVSITGLFLTASSLWLEGQFYAALSTIHALTVVLGLMYIPFGKFFHIFQRPANVGVGYYKQANEQGVQAACRRCAQPFAGGQHVADLQVVLAQLGFDYGDDHGNYQDTCPRCRRALVALAQTARVGGFG
jgi:hypothetical protein